MYIEETAFLTLDMLVVETVSKLLVTMPAQNPQGTLQVLRFDALWCASQDQLENVRTVTVRPRSIKPARPTQYGGPEGQASDVKSAPDVSAEWLGEVADMEADDAQHCFGASDLEADEIDIHRHEVGPSESSDAASGRGNTKEGFADGDCGQPQHQTKACCGSLAHMSWKSGDDASAGDEDRTF